MSNQVVQGLTYPDIPITIKDTNGAKFPLANTTVTFTATQAGVSVLVQFITIDVFGSVTAASGLSLGPDGADAGVVIQDLTAADTAALPRGWVNWAVTITDTTGAPYQVDCGRWHVTTTASCLGDVTKRTLRRMILAEVGDLKLLTATADGSDVTFIDATNLFGENNAYIDRQAYFSEGTLDNLGELRHVVGSNRDQRAIGFGLQLPADTTTGDVVELVNTRGTGYQIADIHRALDDALITARDVALSPVSMELTTPFVRDEGVVTIPDGWALISGIQWQDECNRWRSIRIAPRVGGDGWSVDRFNRLIEIGGGWGYRLDGRTVRLMGAITPDTLVHDDDTTPVNPEWLVAEAVARVVQGAYLRHPTQERRDLVFQAQQKANGLRPLIIHRLPPNSVKLR